MTFRSVLDGVFPCGVHVCADPTVEGIQSALRAHECVEFHTVSNADGYVHGHAGLIHAERFDLLDDCLSFTMLREPVEHAISVFAYMQKQRQLIEPFYRARGVEYPETIEQFVDNPCHLNSQTAFLAASPILGGAPTIDHLRAASRLLRLPGMRCGITERYADFLRLFEHATGRAVPDRCVRNVNRNPARPSLREVPEALVRMIRERSDLDAQLYALACERATEQRCDLPASARKARYHFIAAAFDDGSKSERLMSEGYVVEPFLDPSDLSRLSELFRATTPTVPSDYFVTAFHADASTKRRIFEGIRDVVEPKLQRLAPGYALLNASFVNKKAQSLKGRLGLHQDYTLVDTAAFVPLNAWIPLCDVDGRNGCMKVVAGSHRLRHISATPPNPSPYDDLREVLDREYMIEVPMRAGEALLFDTGVLHETEENVTAADRTSVFLNLYPANAIPRIYFWNRDRPLELRVFEVTTEFMHALPPNTYLPHPESLGAVPVGVVDYLFDTLTAEDLERLLPRPRRPAPHPVSGGLISGAVSAFRRMFSGSESG